MLSRSKGKNCKFWMKSGSISIIIFLVLASFSGLFIFNNDIGDVSATTYYVGGTGGGNYSTIQSAINAASSGDTIYVYNGTYYENVVVNKTLTLIGADRTTTTVVGNGTGDVIKVIVNQVEIRGFTVKNCGNARLDGGIKLHNVNNCSIIGNNVSSNGFSGIILLTANDNIINDNIISFNNGSGLVIRYTSTRNIVSNNSIHDNYQDRSITWWDTGGLIIVYFSNNNIFSHNTIVNNHKYGILHHYSNNNIMKFNIINGHQNGTNFESTNRYLNFYLNDYTNNTKQVIGVSSSRSWNSPIKFTYIYNNTNFTNYMGNYWDDYTGNDSNGDGIGDTPYNIGIGTEHDLYPLVRPIAYYTILPPSTEVDMNATYSNSTNITVYIDIQTATLNASVTGDFNGSINFTDLQLVTINSSSFAGKGFFKSNWTANLEGQTYDGTWKGMLYKGSGERKIYLKGTLFGDLLGITDGFLIESTSGSGVYNVFNSTSTIYKIAEDITFTQLTLNGTLDIHSTLNTSSEIYVLQALFTGTATGFYYSSLSVTLLHIRINNNTHQYYGSGFSTMSYISAWGSGFGWTYDRVISHNVVNLTGFFTPPLWGIVFGILNETGTPKTLLITIFRLDLGSQPTAIVTVDIWGPSLASPGQTVNYIVEFKNTGLKNAYNTEIVMVLSNNVTYIYSTVGGSFNNITKEITWRINISAKSRAHVYGRCTLHWNLTLGTHLNTTGFIRNYVTNTTLSSKTWRTLLTLAIDPNQKTGPEGYVAAGQKLNYRIEFENVGKGIAYGVYFTDTLSKYLDDSTLQIGSVYSKSTGLKIASPGIYDPGVRTISWFVGEVGPGAGGYADISINVRSDAPVGAEILNYGIVYFPSVPEITKTNGIVSIVIGNQGPRANAGTDRIVNTLEKIIFDGSGSYDPDGRIVSYSWSFGDGTYGQGKVVSQTYLDDGTYFVTLTVTDNYGFTDSHQIKVRVLNRDPTARLTIDQKDVNTREVIFNATGSSDLDGVVSEYYFDFGDGTSSGWVQTPVISHKFKDRSKIYAVELQVRDDDGAINLNTVVLQFTLNERPISVLSVDPEEAFTFTDVVFDGGLSTDPDGKVKSYLFDFGDGTDSGWINTASISHQYTDGTKQYTISLKVKDTYGALSEELAVANILIKNRKPVPSLMVADTDVYIFEEVVFDASCSFDTDGEKLQYYFDFGDKTNSGWVTEPLVTHTYQKGKQDYSVKLIVKDDDGETDSVTIILPVNNRAPFANAGADVITTVGQEVEFNGELSYDPDGGDLTYSWDFGDGMITDWLPNAKTTHAYTKADNYTVTLTVSDGALTSHNTCKVWVKASDHDNQPETAEPGIDTDGDGINDDADAFPTDPAASVDSDGDQYPDSWHLGMTEDDSTTGLTLDDYPDDPSRHTSTGTDKSDALTDNVYLMVIILIFIVILVIGILTSIILKKKNNRSIAKPFDTHDMISQVRDAIVDGEVPPDTDDSTAELWSELRTKYQNGQISEATYRLLEQEKERYESFSNEK